MYRDIKQCCDQNDQKHIRTKANLCISYGKRKVSAYITIQKTVLENQTSIRYQGIILDGKLIWKDHIKQKEGYML